MASKRTGEDGINPSQTKHSRRSPPADNGEVGGVGGVGGSLTATSPARLFRHIVMQIYTSQEAYDPDGEKEAWVEMDMNNTHVRFEISSGINFFFYDDFYKIIPYGPQLPVICNADMCGFEVAAGFSLKWQYDHMFHYSYGDTKRAFMIAKLRLKTYRPPFTIKESHLVEDIMRKRFCIPKSAKLTTPCWFSKSQIESERDMYKALYASKDQELTEAFKEFGELDVELRSVRTKERLQSEALKSIDEALQCALCLQRFPSTGYITMASCGHVICAECHKLQEKKEGADVCSECRAPVRYWQEFRGFTGIASAITTLNAKLAA
jgi:hypothetical protein